jgi:hypothetical protein
MCRGCRESIDLWEAHQSEKPQQDVSPFRNSRSRLATTTPEVQKANASSGPAYGTAQRLTRQYAEMLMDPLCVL